MEIFLQETFYPKNDTCLENSQYVPNEFQKVPNSFDSLSYTISFILSLIFSGLAGTFTIQKISGKGHFTENKSKNSTRIPFLQSFPIVGPFLPLLWKGKINK